MNGTTQINSNDVVPKMSSVLYQSMIVIYLLLKQESSESDEFENFFNIQPKFLGRDDIHRNVQFLLYTRSNIDDPKQLSVEDDTTYEDLDIEKETQIFIHGWLSNRKFFTASKDALIRRKDCNVIIVEWGWLAFNKYYETSNLTIPIGELTAQLVDNLVTKRNLNISNLHIVGHSFGAHIAGIIGHRIKSGVLPRITGLDVARVPHKSDSVPLENKLDTSDAECVQVVHTASGWFGIDINVGHADFYPNGGTDQPDCRLFDFAYSGCSHLIVLRYHEQWCRNPHIYEAEQCDSWEEYEAGKCSKNNRVYMVPDIGEPCPEGTYYLRT